jgi:hypothetical protein
MWAKQADGGRYETRVVRWNSGALIHAKYYAALQSPLKSLTKTSTHVKGRIQAHMENPMAQPRINRVAAPTSKAQHPLTVKSKRHSNNPIRVFPVIVDLQCFDAIYSVNR